MAVWWHPDSGRLGAHRRELCQRVQHIFWKYKFENFNFWIFFLGRFSSFMVAAGGVDRTSTETGEEFQTSTVGIPHENFNANLFTDNIALIKLPKNFTLCKPLFYISYCVLRTNMLTFQILVFVFNLTKSV
jgi:hypothetical protein